MRLPKASKVPAHGLPLALMLLVSCTAGPSTTDSTHHVASQNALKGLGSPSETLNWTGRGHEPFWFLSIKGLETELRQPGAGYFRTAESVEIQSPTASKTVAKFVANGTPYLVATRTKDLCIDQATGAPLPYAMTVQSGEQVFSGCGGSPEEFLSSGNWVVEDIDGHGVVDGGEPRIKFEIDGAVTLNTVCRKILGKYTIQGSELTFKFEPVDDGGCKPDALMTQEGRMLDASSFPLQLRAKQVGKLALQHGDRHQLLLAR